MNYSRVRWAHSEFPGNSVRCEFHPREIYFIASIRLPPPPSTRSSAIVFIVASSKRVTRLRNIGRNTWPRIKPSGRKIDARKIRAALECELVAGTFSEPAAFFFSFFRISIFDLLPLHCRCRRNRGRLPNPSPDSSPLLAKIISTYLLAGGITFIGTCWRFHPSDGACRCWLNPARLLPAAEGAFLCRTGLASPTVPILRRRARDLWRLASVSKNEQPRVTKLRSARLAGGGYYYYGLEKNGKAKFVTSSILLLGISPFFPIFFPSPTCEFWILDSASLGSWRHLWNSVLSFSRSVFNRWK